MYTYNALNQVIVLILQCELYLICYNSYNFNIVLPYFARTLINATRRVIDIFLSILVSCKVLLCIFLTVMGLTMSGASLAKFDNPSKASIFTKTAAKNGKYI